MYQCHFLVPFFVSACAQSPGRSLCQPASVWMLQVSLGRAELDVGAILQQQRILLRGVPVGSGRIVFTAPQFGAFLRHPLMIEAAATAVQVLLRIPFPRIELNSQ